MRDRARDAYTGPVTPAPLRPTVKFEQLSALDIRVGTIVSVSPVANSNRLAKLRVSFGDHERQILAGLMQERQDVQALVGVQTLFVVNLEPKKMAGESSEGMLLDVGYADHLLPALVVLERAMPDGTRAG